MGDIYFYSGKFYVSEMYSNFNRKLIHNVVFLEKLGVDNVLGDEKFYISESKLLKALAFSFLSTFKTVVCFNLIMIHNLSIFQRQHTYRVFI